MTVEGVHVCALIHMRRRGKKIERTKIQFVQAFFVRGASDSPLSTTSFAFHPSQLTFDLPTSSTLTCLTFLKPSSSTKNAIPPISLWMSL